jgi:hypothetical protein
MASGLPKSPQPPSLGVRGSGHQITLALPAQINGQQDRHNPNQSHKGPGRDREGPRCGDRLIPGHNHPEAQRRRQNERREQGEPLQHSLAQAAKGKGLRQSRPQPTGMSQGFGRFRHVVAAAESGFRVELPCGRSVEEAFAFHTGD